MPSIEVIPIEAVGKPRMTRRDRWKKRPVVVRYNVWKDTMRLFLARKLIPKTYHLVCFFQMPKSYSKKKKDELRGRPHQQKPDRDNIDKAYLDMLFGTPKYPGPLRYLGDDKIMHHGAVTKYWWDYPCIVISSQLFAELDDMGRATPFDIMAMADGTMVQDAFTQDPRELPVHTDSEGIFKPSE